MLLGVASRSTKGVGDCFVYGHRVLLLPSSWHDCCFVVVCIILLLAACAAATAAAAAAGGGGDGGCDDCAGCQLLKSPPLSLVLRELINS